VPDLIDNETVEMLVEMGLLRELLHDFDTSIDHQLSAIQAAFLASDLAEARVVAHALKGVSLQMGAKSFGAACRLLEKDAMALSTDQGLARLASLRGLWIDTRAKYLQALAEAR